MDLPVFDSFVKRAAKVILDADIRELIADRKGREKYLPGGQLPSNAILDEGGQYVEKMAEVDASLMGLSSGSYDFDQLKNKKSKIYDKIRTYGGAGVTGGLKGLAVLGAYRGLRGSLGDTPLKHLRIAAGLGAGWGVLDKAFERNVEPVRPARVVKTAAVAPMPGRSFTSPATAFDAARRTGGFKTSIIRNLGNPPKVVQLGRKFLAR